MSTSAAPAATPDWTGPDDLAIKIAELREITDWEKPIYVKIGASRPYYDVKLAVKAGADVIVLDGMQGGTAATQEVFIEHVGIPILPAIPQAVQALQEMGMHRQVQLIVSGGIRNGADVAKAMALGADAVAIGTAALVALGDNHPRLDDELKKIGSAAGYYDDWQNGRDPAGITTQDPELSKRLEPVEAGRRLANYLRVLVLEAQTMARACGKSHLHNLDPEDLVALTVEAAAMARVPLAAPTGCRDRCSTDPRTSQCRRPASDRRPSCFPPGNPLQAPTLPASDHKTPSLPQPPICPAILTGRKHKFAPRKCAAPIGLRITIASRQKIIHFRSMR